MSFAEFLGKFVISAVCMTVFGALLIYAGFLYESFKEGRQK